MIRRTCFAFVLSVVFSLVLSTIVYAEVAVYDFESLTVGQDINGQDGWVAFTAALTDDGLAPSATVEMTTTSGAYTGSKAFAPGSEPASYARISRKNDVNWSLPSFSNAQTVIIEYSFERNHWGSWFQLGYDVDDDGDLFDTDELSVGLFCSALNNSIILRGADGSDVAATTTVDLGEGWTRISITIDMAANSGQGAASVRRKHLTGNGAWVDIPGLQNINVGINTAAVDRTNPANWHGMFFHGQNGESDLDDIVITTNNAPVAGFMKALDFDGANDFAQIPHSSSLNIGSEITIEAWIYPRSLDRRGGIVVHRWGNVNTDHIFTTHGTELRYNASYGYTGGSWLSFSQDGLEPLKWQHVAVRVTSDKHVFLYIDGEEFDKGYYTQNLISSNSSWYIGREAWGWQADDLPSLPSTQFFDGHIEEVRIWNKALGGTTIQDWMYREIDSTHPDYGNLKAYYKLNEGSGASAGDYTGINDGTLNGPVWTDTEIPTVVTDEDTPGNGHLVGSDEDGDPLTFHLYDSPSNGSVTVNGDGSFTYTPNPDYNGSDNFSYKVNDGTYDSNVAVVGVSVNAVNDPPVAVDDHTTTPQDLPVMVDVLANDSDADNDPLTVTDVGSPSNGVATDNGDGTVTFSPNPYYNGSDSFGYTVSDGQGGSATATVFIDVTPSPAPSELGRTSWVMHRGGGWIDTETVSKHGDESLYEYASIPSSSDPGWGPAPDGEIIGFSESSILPGYCLSAADFTYFQTFVDFPSDVEVTEFTITFNGIDDGARITIFNSNHPFGIVVPGSYVFLSVSATANLREYVNAGETNRVVITQVDDCPVDNNLREARVVLNGGTIHAENQPPVAGFGKALDFSTNDYLLVPPQSDINFGGSDDFTFSVWIRPQSGGIIAHWHASGGQLQIYMTASTSSGQLTFALGKHTTGWDWWSAPASLESGCWTHVTFVKEGGTRRVYVNGVMSSQSAIKSYVLAAAPSTNSKYIGVDPYNMSGYFDGGMDDFRVYNTALDQTTIQNWMYREIDKTHPKFGNLVAYYKLNEGSGATAGDYAGGNNDGTLKNMESSDWVDSDIPTVITDEDMPVSGHLVGSDEDGDPLTFDLYDSSSHGSVTVNGDGTFTYTPNPDYNGPDSFSYLVNDGTYDSNVAVVAVSVNAVNDPPVADAQSVETDEDVSVAITLTGSDPENNPLTYTVNTGLVHGALSGTAPNLTYAPNANYNGGDSFTFTVNDGTVDSDPATVFITVNSVNDPPVAHAGGPYTGNEGSAILFDGRGSSDIDGTIATYEWDLDGNGFYDDATGATVSKIWSDDYSGSIGLQVTDDGGLTDIAGSTVAVLNVAPIANAGANQTVNEGDVVSFSGSVTDPGGGDTHTFDWDFGDGGTASGSLTPTHVYADNGVYEVTLTVTDDDGAGTTDELTVTVNNVVPSVDAAPDAVIDEGGTFTRSGSFSDPGDDTWTATVDYGEGSGTQSLSLNADKTFSLSHTYADDGDYTVTVTVRDDEGGVGTDATEVKVNNVAPTVTASANPTVVDEGTPVSFSGGFTDPGSVDTHTIVWDFGDGNTVSGTLIATHVYGDDGTYTATLTVTDDDGGVGTATVEVTVNNVAPTVVAGVDQTVNEGDVVSFIGDFTDPGSGDTHTIAWTFGDDGTASETLTSTHTYADNGVYTVTLTVTDDDGGVGTATVTVTVLNVAPTVEAGPDQAVDEGTPVSFTGIFTDPGSGDTHEIVWDFGDETETVSGSLTPTHVYADNGVYEVTLTVTDDDGAATADKLTVTVDNVDPTVNASAIPMVANEADVISFTGSFTDPGSADTHTFVWDFGDGSTDAEELAPEHAYGDDGVYSVSLTVTDDDGGVGTATVTVTINNVLPTVVAGSDQTLTAGDFAPFNGSFTDPGWLDTHTATWDHGDETSGAGAVTEENVFPDATGTVTGGHSYFQAGEYTVTLSVTDDLGIGSDALKVTVNAIEATIDFDPNTLNLTKSGKWVTVFIELPDGYDVRNIVHTEESPVMLNGVVPAITDPKYGFVKDEGGYIMDHDGDGISERMVKFDGAAVQEILTVGDEVVVTVTGGVIYDNEDDSDAADFEGQDVIRVIEEGKKVKNAKPVLPEDYALSQNAPNPFNPATTIEYALPEEAHVRLVIYNTMGQSVCTLLDALQPVGYHQFLWDGRNSQGRLVSGGVYFYRLTAGEFTETKRMLLLK